MWFFGVGYRGRRSDVEIVVGGVGFVFGGSLPGGGGLSW